MGRKDNVSTRVDVRIPNQLFEQIEAVAESRNAPINHRSGKPEISRTIVELLKVGITNLEQLPDIPDDTDTKLRQALDISHRFDELALRVSQLEDIQDIPDIQKLWSAVEEISSRLDKLENRLSDTNHQQVLDTQPLLSDVPDTLSIAGSKEEELSDNLTAESDVSDSDTVESVEKPVEKSITNTSVTDKQDTPDKAKTKGKSTPKLTNQQQTPNVTSSAKTHADQPDSKDKPDMKKSENAPSELPLESTKSNLQDESPLKEDKAPSTRSQPKRPIFLADLAKKLGRSPETVRRWGKSGKLTDYGWELVPSSRPATYRKIS
ncbi:MAG: hypothetical protein SAL07_24625 [Oscillatoria sp. PMC 1051.18]|nr:hypothetical protein [Oscillatoria sp. PMC 1050.18]MEC5033095.1 hypothetical protein [Oscillatoria sp. PMC 1051.18]